MLTGTHYHPPARKHPEKRRGVKHMRPVSEDKWQGEKKMGYPPKWGIDTGSETV